MKVRFTLPISTKRGSFSPDEISDVPDLLGNQWMKAGYCVAVEGVSIDTAETAETPAAAQMRRARRTQIAI